MKRMVVLAFASCLLTACATERASGPSDDVVEEVDLSAERSLRLARLHGKQLSLRAYVQPKGGSKRLIGVSRMSLALDPVRGRLQAVRSSSAETRSREDGVLRDDPPETQFFEAFEEAYPAIAAMYDASTESVSPRTDIGPDSLVGDLFAVDTTDDSQGVVGGTIGYENQVLGVSFDTGGDAYVYSDFSYDGDELTGATIHVSLDGVNEYLIEVDDQGEIVMPEVESLVFADASECNWAIAGAVGAAVVLAAELYPPMKAARGVVSLYRLQQGTGTPLEKLSRAMPTLPRKAFAHFGLGLASLTAFRDAVGHIAEEC